mmetsp:Transcript_88304/g.250271  ORF Transcript_88304/g.250271 Transcript_88304/m.250271 type:complete len:132 (+) Transcript_88304:1-396(+)
MRGDSGRHFAERFLGKIANSPPAAVSTPKAGLQMVTPPQLAMEVIDERRRVVETFLEWLQSARVEEGHLELQRELLVRSLEVPQAAAEPGWEALEAVYRGGPGGDTGDPKQDVEALWKPKIGNDDDGRVFV